MLTQPLRQTAEYQSLLAAVAGHVPAAAALFGLPPTARAQVLAALCEDTGRPALVICAGEADAVRFAADASAFGQRAEAFPARDFTFRTVEGQSHEYEYRRLAVLGNVVGGRTRVVCAGAEAFLQYTVPKADFCANTMTIRTGNGIVHERPHPAAVQRRVPAALSGGGARPVRRARRHRGPVRPRYAEALPH